MGISGLLKEVSGIAQRKVHIEDFAGKRAMVDASTWLYRGCYACAREVALGIPTNKFLRFVMHRVNMLQYHKVKVTMVFDGKVLPLKRGTNEQRRRSKKTALAKAKQFEAQAKQCRDKAERKRLWGEADKFYKQAYSPKFEHASQLIKKLQEERVDFIVAPYEADAQLVCRAGHGDLIVTEDSDLLVFCAAAKVAAPVLFKMGDDGCFDQVIRLDANLGTRAGEAAEKGPACRPFLRKLRDFSPRMFVQCCILAGCDYNAGLVGVGLRKAQDLVIKFKSTPDHERLATIVKHVGEQHRRRRRKAAAKLARSNSRTSPRGSGSQSSQDSGTNAPATPRGDRATSPPGAGVVGEEDQPARDYALTFARIELAFQYQSVFDPVALKMAHLLDLPCKVRNAGPASECAWSKLATHCAGAAAADRGASVGEADGVQPAPASGAASDSIGGADNEDEDDGYIRPSTLDLNFLGPAYPAASVARVARGDMNPRLVRCGAGGGHTTTAAGSDAAAAAAAASASVFPMFAHQASRAATAAGAKPRTGACVVTKPLAAVQSKPAFRSPAPAPGADLEDMIQAALALERKKPEQQQRGGPARRFMAAATLGRVAAGSTLTPSPHRRGRERASGAGKAAGLPKKARLTAAHTTAVGSLRERSTSAVADVDVVDVINVVDMSRATPVPRANCAQAMASTVSPMRSAEKATSAAASAAVDANETCMDLSIDGEEGDGDDAQQETLHGSTGTSRGGANPGTRYRLSTAARAGRGAAMAGRGAARAGRGAASMAATAAAATAAAAVNRLQFQSMLAVSASFLQRTGKFKAQGKARAQSIKGFFIQRSVARR